MADWPYLELADFVLIAEAALDADPNVLSRTDRLVSLAEWALAAPAASFEGIEFNPEFAQKAALPYSRLARNHPLPDGNRCVAYLCMIEFIERNSYAWDPTTTAEASLEETIRVLEGTAAGTIPEKDFVDWVRTRISEGLGGP